MLRRRVGEVMIAVAGRLFAAADRLSPADPVPTPKVRPGTIVPAAFGDATSEAASDLIFMQLETIFAGGIPGTAASMAIGYADAYARFALRHPDAFE